MLKYVFSRHSDNFVQRREPESSDVFRKRELSIHQALVAIFNHWHQQQQQWRLVDSRDEAGHGILLHVTQSMNERREAQRMSRIPAGGNDDARARHLHLSIELVPLGHTLKKLATHRLGRNEAHDIKALVSRNRSHFHVFLADIHGCTPVLVSSL